jgi:hypothetical protein
MMESARQPSKGASWRTNAAIGVPEKASRYQILQTAKTRRQNFVVDWAPLGRAWSNHDKFACKGCFQHKPSDARHFMLISRAGPRRKSSRATARDTSYRSAKLGSVAPIRLPARRSAEHSWRYFANDFVRFGTPRHITLLYHFFEHLPISERVHRTPEPFVPIGDEVS